MAEQWAVCRSGSIVGLAMPLFIIAFISVANPSGAEPLQSSADIASIRVQAYLDAMGAKPGSTRTLSTADTLDFIGLGAELGLNVFELLDAANRWAVPARVRFLLVGENLKEAARRYDLGRERVRSLLPLDLMTRLEFGAILLPGQRALEGTLAAPYEEYVEIGTIKLATSFGFGALEPNRFLKPYGISVSRFLFTSSLDRLELYAPRKGAIYVRGLPKPKRWNLWVITAY